MGAYSKIHLVPFAELIPFVEYEPVRKFIKKIAGFSYGWTQGTKNTLFEVPLSLPYEDPARIEIIGTQEKAPQKVNALVSAPICYDDAFPHVCRELFLAGCELFMNITNDSWSKTESAEYQHFVVSSYRAIEFRTTLARCTNAGFTVVLDPAGRILDSIDLFIPGTICISIPVYEHKMTFFAMFGEWIPHLILVLFFAFIVWYAKYEKASEIKEISTSLVKTRKRSSSKK